MKGFKAIFAVCLALVGIGGAWADDSGDAVRAATRRDATNTVTSTRKKTTKPSTPTNTVSRSTDSVSKPVQTLRERATTPRATTNVSTASRTSVTTTPTITARTAANVTPRATRTTSGAGVQSTVARTAKTGATRAPTNTPSARSASTVRRSTVARSATGANTSELRDEFMQSNNKQCREIYYTCMDEFCANKDSQLKRCACSSRINEFDSVKRQLENAEEKMLDFSQRLLTVSMDAEDAAVINVATEGELAFNKKDTSKSQQILDEISDRLNTKFQDDSFDRNLTAISLSLNEDAAFDNVDSLMGASTTLKTGTELYAAALPVCREMAAEVCTPEQLSIAESGYQMMIEQDCNTVKKSYQSQADQAREKIHESGALLDMSRLNVYQDRNSDDILTCKSKMLEMLTDTSVCGDDLYKCLDTTGQYIDPSTGEAFLSVNLANLSNLIVRPSGNQQWTTVPSNEKFVTFLNSKKKFLAPAMEHCQDIADYVWDLFIEDALAQIKLAQDAKLEEVRQSCTTLTTQCLSDTAKSIEEFDARALSTFGIMADKTVNAMCADVKNACTALLQVTDDDTDWVGGMNQIATDNTYETILKTCREVGRACIIQSCKSISGNFGLCENIETSVNRKAIVNSTSCWQDVLDCVASADSVSIDAIMNQLVERNDISSESSDTIPAYAFYKTLYGNNITISNDNSFACITGTDMNCIYDICADRCRDANTTDCKTCRIAEQIWGNCEAAPTTALTASGSHNKIRKPANDTQSTLLYWFALNTGTDKMADSCRDTTCGPGYTNVDGICSPSNLVTAEGNTCYNTIINVANNINNCCNNNIIDSYGNCCESGKTISVNATNAGYYITDISANTNTSGSHICVPSDATTITHVATYTDSNETPNTHVLLCLGTISGDTDNNIVCSGKFLGINTATGIYYNPDTSDETQLVTNYYHTGENAECTYSGATWDCNTQPINWKITFNTTSGE